MTTTRDTQTGNPRGSRSRRGATRSFRLPAWLERWPRPARISFLAAAAVLVAIVLLVGVDVAFSLGRIHPGVRVGDVEVGGKTVSQASTTIAAEVADRSAAPVKVTAGGVVWDVTADSVGLSVDSTALAEAAYEVGRGDVGSVLLGRLRAFAGRAIVPIEPGCDEGAFGGLIQTINDAVAKPAVDAGVVVEDGRVTRTEPVDGFGVDIDTARGLVLPAFLDTSRSVSLELVPIKPAIDAAAAEDAYASAVTMISAPVTLYYADKQWEVAPATIGEWIGFRRAEGATPPKLEAYVVSEDVSATVLPMVAEVGKPARDAGFTVSNGTVTLVPGEDGLSADADELSVRLTKVLLQTSDRRAELTMHRVEPSITTAEAQGMGVVERISTFTTTYEASNKPRVNNIHLLADALNGTLIGPGQTFSFNETIGPRTAAKGYQEANAIVNGKLVPQLGGGICQVGTTIFNTVFFSGLPVVERKNHSLYISHYPTGRDATVSWGGPDFKFTNDTPTWVLIATSYTNSSVTISLYGTKPGYEVTYDTGGWTDVKNPPVREVPDPAMPAGSRIIEERGVSGRSVVVVRHVWKNGAEVRTDTFKSVYKPAEEVVRVGTGAGSSPTTTTP